MNKFEVNISASVAHIALLFKLLENSESPAIAFIDFVDFYNRAFVTFPVKLWLPVKVITILYRNSSVQTIKNIPNPTGRIIFSL